MNRAVNIRNSRLGSWLQQNKLAKQLLSSCLGSLIFLCITLGLFINTHYHKQQQILTAHGNTTSQLASSQLTVSMSNNNLIGLQSLLNDLIKQERVENAIIYDVDNKIIVQAGDTNLLMPENYKAFTSPITLDNTILGSLTITFNTHVERNYWSVILLACAAILLPIAIILFFVHREVPQELLEVSRDITVQEKPMEAEESDELTEMPLNRSLLVLHIHTLDKLYQQLNAEARQKQFGQLQTTIKKVLTLYSGQQVAVSPNCIVLSFEDSDTSACSFSALCCAYLLQEFSKQQQWLLYFSAILYNGKDNFDAAQHLPLLAQHFNSVKKPGELLIASSLVDNSNLNDRLKLEGSLQPTLKKVVGFSDTHANLLKNQLSHLINS